MPLTLNPQPSTQAPPCRFPYPYKAALAICSDLDETPDAETYFELIRFLNTTEETSMGTGVGLEVGNSIYFDMPPGHFSYWNTNEENREKIRMLIRSGHIDCLHSYGDLATTRAHAVRALKELEKHGCRLKVWVDHAQAPTNFGADIMKGHGDEPGHLAYHADMTVDYGIRYVWRGRVTSVIGQHQSLSLGGIGNWRHPFGSMRTIAQEAAKQALARCGNRKYQLHGANLAVQRSELRDGTPTYEFLRCNPHWEGVSSHETAFGIGEVLSSSFLGRLIERRGVCILYTHLGKLGSHSGKPRLTESAVNALRRLAECHRTGEIWVTTTGQMLDFLCNHCELGSRSWHQTPGASSQHGAGGHLLRSGNPNARGSSTGPRALPPRHEVLRQSSRGTAEELVSFPDTPPPSGYSAPVRSLVFPSL